MAGHREEVVNVKLAEVLQKHGHLAEPELIIHQGSKRRLPDVLIAFRGLRVVIEGRYRAGAQTEVQVRKKASDRVNSGLAHIAIGVVYPVNLRATPQADLEKQLSTSSLKFAVVSERGAGDFQEGLVADLADALARCHEVMSSEDLVAAAADEVRTAIQQFQQTVSNRTGIAQRLMPILGFGPEVEHGEDA